MLKFIFLYAFIIASIINYVSVILDKKLLKIVSNALIIPFLVVFYALSEQHVAYSFIIGMLLVFIGDLILSINDNKKMLLPSAIFYIASHVFVIIAFCPDIVFSSIPTLYYISVGAVLLGILVAVLVLLRRYFDNKKLALVATYLFSSILMSVFAYFRLACANILISLLGTILLFASNVCLLIAKFDEDKPWMSRFVVIPVHIVSLLLITISFTI